MSGETRLMFAVDSAGTVHELILSGAVSRAYDIMTADRVPPQQAAEMAVGCERDGRDPVAWAEHFVQVRRSLRDSRDTARPP